MHGEHDEIVSLNYLNELSGVHLFKDQVIVIKGASHSPFLEQKDQFLECVLDFIQEIN